MKKLDEHAGWYPVEWFAREDGTVSAEGFQIALTDGPLAGRTALLHEFSLWLAVRDGRLFVRAAQQLPHHLPRGAVLVGGYVCDGQSHQMTWRKAPDDQMAA
jgi:hypothetical protein